MNPERERSEDPPIGRRGFLGLTLGAAALSLGAAALNIHPFARAEDGDGEMYGIIGQIMAKSGERDRLIEILLEGTQDMPGCLAYVVARDTSNADAIWITEVWTDRESHQASLELPAVREAMEKGRPLIAGFGERFETAPVGGAGLARP